MIKRKGTQSIRTSSVCNHKQYELPYHSWSFIQIVAGYYNLKPFLIDRVIFVMTELYGNRLINNIRHANATLACLIFVTSNSGLQCYEDEPIDINEYIQMLYKPAEFRKQSVSVFRCLQVIKDIFQ